MNVIKLIGKMTEALTENAMKMMLRKVCILVVFFASANAFARFYDGGLYFNELTLNEKTLRGTAEVAYASPDSHVNLSYVRDDITIPSIAYYRDAYQFSVIGIGEYAFSGCCYLESVTIPNSVKTIGNSAFLGCYGLTSVTISNSLATIEDAAFLGCRALTSVTIPESVTSIGSTAFSESGLISVSIPKNVGTIGIRAFYNCGGLGEINVNPENQTYCSIDGVLYSKDESELIQYPCGSMSSNFDIPSSVTTIGDYAFSRCVNLTSVAIPGSVITIGNSAFSGCSELLSVNIPNSVATVGAFAFADSGVRSVIIPNSVETIEQSAFRNCRDLASITIGASVSSIGCDAFKLSSNISEIYCLAVTPPVCGNGIDEFEADVLENATLYVPVGHKNEYENVDPWRKFHKIEESLLSGIADVGGEDEGLVSVENGSVVVGGNDAGVVEIYSVSGQLIYRGNDRRIGNLGKGVYIVRVGSRVEKVAL